ncbi:hypothetical protein AGRO_3148 [Agrobacterium sp. ATCC 31749]|nr:hypothetical protein AGRO_3148 [Agrobacterium sp. ATCC 31749]
MDECILVAIFRLRESGGHDARFYRTGCAATLIALWRQRRSTPVRL